jgi:ammonium transporter Rh
LQFTILVRGFWHCVFKNDFDHKIEISIESLVQGNFGAAAVLISLGGYMGTVNASQLVIMAILEVIFYCLNVAVAEEKFHAMDIGGSMIIHSFGAYFGLAACKMRALKKPTSPNKSASYNSNIFAIIGTIFLWMYWPSFNSVLAPTSNIGVRVIVNTVLAIASSCLVTFSLSYRIHHGRFEMEEILNASLAGAVAVGTCADMTEHFGFAILIGILGGAVSTLGFAYLSACLERVLGLYDTAGINNLHGLPVQL